MLTAVVNRDLTSSWTRGIRNTETPQNTLVGTEKQMPVVIQNDLARPQATECDEPKAFLMILLGCLGTLPA